MNGRLRLFDSSRSGGPPLVDGGLRLLTADRWLRDLRWTSDPHAPVVCGLLEGQARLAVVALDMDSASRGAQSMTPWTTSFGARWLEVVAPGEGMVVESVTPRLPLGTRVRSSFPVSTYVVVTDTVVGAAVLPRETTPSLDRAVPLLHAVDMDEIERRVRRRGESASVQSVLGCGPFPCPRDSSPQGTGSITVSR